MKNYRTNVMNTISVGLIGTLSLTGCQSNNKFISKITDPYHQIFRHDEVKNAAPLEKPIEIDYKDYDENFQVKIVNDRAYFSTDNVVQKPIIEELVNVPQTTRHLIPEINSYYFGSPSGDVIIPYNSRNPPADLKVILESYLPGIVMKEYPTQNMLIFSGKKEAFGENFGYFTDVVNELDVAPKQIRLRLRVVNLSRDNTYNKDFTLSALRKGLEEILTVNLPSSSNPTESLQTGIAINAFGLTDQSRRNHFSGVVIPNDVVFDSAIKFLDSYGNTKIVQDVDVLVQNGKKALIKNQSLIPYPSQQIVGTIILNATEYKPTGADIAVTPSANEKGIINIKIEKAESGEQSISVGKQQVPTFRTADLQSEVTLRNAETYFLGATLFTRDHSIDRGIPGLNKIPFIKDIFTAREKEKRQEQLLYFITAREIPRDSLVGIQPRE